MQSQPVITCFTVATGLYLEHWAQQAQDADTWLFPGQDVQLIVFTDQPEEAVEISGRLSRAQVTVQEVPPLRWPEATMQRYELIGSAAAIVRGKLLMHLDADMRITAPVGPELDPSGWSGGVALVQHPGFYRSPSLAKRLRSSRTLASNVRLRMAHEGGIGQWERRVESRAYVEPRRRQTYVHGAVWFGQREPLLQMTAELAARTSEDLAHGIIARWHDESYLNWFAAYREPSILSPRYSYVQGYSQLRGVDHAISSVDKGTRRER